MNESKQIIVGKRYEMPELIDAGIYPLEFLLFLDEPLAGYPFLTVTEVDHENHTITFDSEPE